jgi:hypothetical protein
MVKTGILLPSKGPFTINYNNVLLIRGCYKLFRIWQEPHILKKNEEFIDFLFLRWFVNLWICFARHFQQYFSYIMEVSFIDGGNRVPGENHRPAASHWQFLSYNVSSPPRHKRGAQVVVNPTPIRSRSRRPHARNMNMRFLIRRGGLDTLYDKNCQWLAAGRWFSPGTRFPPSIKLTSMI